MSFFHHSSPILIRLFLAISILSIFVFGGACATTPSIEEKKLLAHEKLKEAKQFASADKKTEMFASLHQAIELAPEEPIFHMELGTVYFFDGKLDDAEKEFKTVLELDSKMVDAYRGLGRINMIRQDWGKALFYLNQILALPGIPSPHEIYNWIAVSYYAKGDFDLAEKSWKKAIGIKDNEEIRLNLALAYKDNGLFNLAYESLKKAIELNPELTRAHYEIAQLYLKNKKMMQAKKHFHKVIALEPLGKMAKSSREYLKLLLPKKDR